MPGDQQRYKRMMSQGHSAAWDQEWGKAVGYYRQALEEFPDSIQAIISIASAYFEMGDFDAALDEYRKVIVRSPNDILVLEKIARIFEIQGHYKAGAETSLRVAEVHLKNGDTNKAVENWQRTIRLSPNNLKARMRLANQYEATAQLQPAVAELIVIASLFQHEGEKTRALDTLQHALKLQPKNLEAQQALGLLRANQFLPLPDVKRIRREALPIQERQLTQLEAPVEKASEARSPIAAAEKNAIAALAAMIFEGDAIVSTARDVRNLQDIALGTGPLNRVQQDQTRITLHISQAVDLQARGHRRQAAEELERAIAIGLDQAAAFFDLGILFEREGKLDQAIRNLQTSVKHADYALPSRLMIGRILLRQERLHESAIQYLEAIRLADMLSVPEDKQLALMQAYEPRLEAFANESNPEIQGKLVKSVEKLLNQDHWLDKVKQLRQQLPEQTKGLPPLPVVDLITEMQGSQVVDMLTNIHDLTRRGYYRIAMEEAFIAIEFAPTYLPLHTFMGEILIKQDRLSEAITKFNTVARAYSARGEADRSVDLFRRITRMAPLDLSTRQRLIEQLTASGKVEDTVQEYLELGDVYYRLAELDKARETYQRALNLSQQAKVPSEWMIEILHHLADIDLQRLDWKQAVKIFEQIVRIDPGDRKASIGLVDLYFRLMNDKAALAALGNYVAYLNRQGLQHEILETLENLVANNPEQVPLRRTLAEQYQLAGNHARAIEIWDDLGNQLLNDRDIPGARQAIEAILALNPDNAADYRRVLENLNGDRL